MTRPDDKTAPEQAAKRKRKQGSQPGNTKSVTHGASVDPEDRHKPDVNARRKKIATRNAEYRERAASMVEADYGALGDQGRIGRDVLVTLLSRLFALRAWNDQRSVVDRSGNPKASVSAETATIERLLTELRRHMDKLAELESAGGDGAFAANATVSESYVCPACAYAWDEVKPAIVWQLQFSDGRDASPGAFNDAFMDPSVGADAEPQEGSATRPRPAESVADASLRRKLARAAKRAEAAESAAQSSTAAQRFDRCDDLEDF